MDLLQRLQQGRRVDEPVALVLAHPDDETAGLGSRLASMKRLRLIYLTDGAPRDLADARREGFADWATYAKARREELDRALSALGASGIERVHYDYPDQQAIGHLEEIVDLLCHDLKGMHAVFTHPYEHGHPDHDSAALAVWSACRIADGAPQRFEFPSYYRAGGRRLFGEFFPDPNRPETELPLSEGAAAAKGAALACFRSQREVLSFFPVAPERVRRAPGYDFTRRAPPGEAVYDEWGWELTSSRWLEDARRFLANVDRKELAACG